MALPESVIPGGTKVGTSGNDDLSTSEYDIMTAITTIYSALSGLGGDDILNNNGQVENVTLDGGADNDRIYNTLSGGGQSPSIVGGDGDDVIENGYATDQLKANNATIDAGAGSDTVDNYGDNALITLGDGDNSLYHVGDKATITSGNGADNISVYGDDVSISTGAGDDYVGGSGSNVTVSGGAGNDLFIYSGDNSYATNVLLDDTQGTNYFRISNSNNSTINAGNGADSVASSHNQKTLINIGAGNNSVTSEYDSEISIQAQGGNDTINIYDGNKILIAAGDGANYIEIHNVNDSTSAGFTINAGAGADSIINRANDVLISAGDGNNSISNGAYGGDSGDNVTINTGSGNDFINNYYDSSRARGARQENVIINAGAGNDTVTNSTDKVTIDGGAGNDELSSYDSSDVSINGGAGADTIYIANGTVSGGAGDDSLSAGDKVLIQYAAGDGNDAVWSFDENSTLSIGGGNYSSAVSGSDVVLTVGNGKITLSEAATLDTLNIVGTYGDGDTTLADTIKAAVVADMILHRTEAGYPVIAGMAFHPEEYHGGEPTNYVSKETWSITSTDGLELEGYHYTPENSNDKWVLIIHGYGHNHKHMYPFAGFYLDNGYNVLMVDQRAAGESEGEWLTMGAAESQDIALWTQEIARRNSNAKITLFGVSMGSATAMLAAARSDITNVTSLVEDCGYTNMMDVVRLLHSNIPAMQSLLSAQDLPVLDTVASVFTGYNLSDAAPLDSISAAKMPSLFITGTEDAVVPVSALTALYDASGADVKEKFIVDGATHGVAGLYDPIGYSNTVFRFLAEANEEGWVTENIYDDIFLSGTKYADSITNSGDNVTISTGDGNDTITNSGDNVSIDAGAGNNLIDNSGNSQVIVFNGQTTVDGFNLGFGDGTDTLYIPGNPAGVDFRSGILTFYDDSNAVVLSDVTSTAKVNLYHESRQMLNKGVFIADNEWYSVESGDLTVKSGEEVYFVGPSATPNHGVDFSGISSNLNLTLDTAYIDSEDYVPGTTTWINGVYSIRGGAGLTTITGSKLSDTIFSGTGATTINARGGNDYISLTSARALVNYETGDGDDLITGFNENSTLNLSGEKYSSVKSGNDLILSVGDEKVTLQGAANLSNVHIVGTLSGSDTISGKIIRGGNSADYISDEISDGDTVQGLGGNDTIISNSNNVLLDGGRDDDLLQNNEGDNVTMSGGAGSDTLQSDGNNASLNGGAGSDLLNNGTTFVSGGENVTMSGGAGDDSLNNHWGEKVSMSGGDGSDTLYTNAASVTMNGGAGSDRISLTVAARNTLIEYKSGDGNDLITGFDENDTLNLSGANYSSAASGNDLILTVGNGRLTLEDAATLDTVNIIGTNNTVTTPSSGINIENSVDHTLVTGTAYNDTIINYGKRVTVRGLAGDDYLVNMIDSSVTAESAVANLFEGGDGNDTIFSYHSYHPTLLGGEGNDRIIVNKGHMNYIDGGNGNDTILGVTTDTQDSSDWAMGGYATIFGGNGNDYIDPFYTNNSTIDGGEGNDTINMMGANSTITGGEGDDKISLGTADSVNVRINYADGDGNDLIQGFTENDTLNISGAQYASLKNGSDIILMVGDGRLTLKGAVNLDTVNIIGSYDEASDSIISNSDNRVSVAGTSANDTIVNTGRYDTIQGLAGNDSIDNSGENGLIFGDEGNDIIRNSGSNVYIYGNAGNDSIYSSGTNNTIFGGDGSNRVSLSGSNASFVVLEGKTTVDGFTTGFGSGADTVYVTGAPAVDFKSGGLTFYEESNGDSLTLNNVTDTEKVYLYYTETNRTRKGIFIAKNDMYTVTDSDFSLRSNEGLYFVGTSATNNHGVDFSSITQAINVTLNTDYNASPQFWVNNVHSIIGGAGRTQITGSDEDDTIIAYTGATTINAGDGNDHIILSTAQARVNYEAGDGNDLIQNFGENSTLNISGSTFVSAVSGENVILTVGTENITLQGAADLETLNIVGTTEGENDYSGGDKTISDYSGQPIKFNATFEGSAFSNGNFQVYSPTGTLTVENVADKIIDLRDGDGNVFVKAYTPSQAGLIDGRGISGIEIIEGSAAGTDVIFAGDGGSSLWGGSGTAADALVGGAGMDIFNVGRNQGNDNIFTASSTDIVNLTDATLSDIVGTLGNDNGIAIGFNTGTVINIQSTDTLSAAINLADGSSWRFNHTTKAWQNT